MRIVDQVIEIVERHARDVGLAQQREPLGRRPLPEDLGQDRVDLGIVPRPGCVIGKARIGGEFFGAADGAEERRKMPVGIDEDAHIAVAGVIRPPVGRQQAAVAGSAHRRLVAAPRHVIDQHELRHGLEHRQLDRLALAGAVALDQGREDDMDRVEADDAIGDRQRHIARLAAADAADQPGDRRDALDEIVIGRPARIGPALAVAHQAHIDDPRIGRAHLGGPEVEPAHRRRADVVDEDVGAPAQFQHGRPAGRLLHVEHHAALIAIDLQIDRAHAGTAHRAAGAHDVARGRLDLDHVGAVIAEDLGRERTHQHGRHVDDAHALERAAGCCAFLGLIGHAGRDLGAGCCQSDRLEADLSSFPRGGQGTGVPQASRCGTRAQSRHTASSRSRIRTISATTSAGAPCTGSIVIIGVRPAGDSTAMW